MDRPPKILIVDDTPRNLKLLDALLSPRGYAVVSAASGPEALTIIPREAPDLVVLDVVMPEMDGYEVCRQIRADPATAVLPVIMVTASDGQDKTAALEAGADDFITKPLDDTELLARVRSLLRIKQYLDTIQAQSAELAVWNQTLEKRVDQQVQELQRLERLRRFLSPQVAELVVSSGDEAFLLSHRREIAAVFCDLVGFTAFAEEAEPEEVMRVLSEFHEAMGRIVFRYEGTLERFAGDGLMIFFNDPLPCSDPCLSAVRMALAMRQRARELAVEWAKRGYELGFSAAVALGYATLGRIGFEGRFDYAAVGTVTNLVTRLCGEARNGQILANQAVFAAVESSVDMESLGELELKGLRRPVPAFFIQDLKPSARAAFAHQEAEERNPLTPREQEVAALIAQGCSNSEIALRLVITPGTAANHVEHILGKLGFSSRAQVATWATENKLLA